MKYISDPLPYEQILKDEFTRRDQPLDLEIVRGTSRLLHHVRMRRLAARILRTQALSLHAIGELLSKDHATILYYLKNEGWGDCDKVTMPAPSVTGLTHKVEFYKRRIQELEGQIAIEKTNQILASSSQTGKKR